MTQPSTKPPSYDIEEILTRLPDLTQLFERDGHTPKKFGGGWFVRCPFHEDGSPSCHIHNERGKFHCYGCGAKGDAIDYYQKTRDLSFQDTLVELAHIAGVGPTCDTSQPVTRASKSAAPPTVVAPLLGPALEKWQAACQSLLADGAEIERIAAWRGIEPGAVAFAAARGLIGSYPYWGVTREAFLVEMPTSDSGMLPVSVHVRLAPGSKGNEASEKKASWRYDPPGCGAWPWVVGDLATARHIFVVEGQWDALALISMMGWHVVFPPTIAVAGLRGAASVQKLLAHPINPEAYIFAIADADAAGEKWFEEKGLLAMLGDRLRKRQRLHAFWPNSPGSDLNDMVKSGSFTRNHMLALLLPRLPTAKASRPPGLTFVQWCRRHRTDPAPLGAAAAHILSDRSRPKGRRPPIVWVRHWDKTGVPPDLLTALNDALHAFRTHPGA